MASESHPENAAKKKKMLGYESVTLSIDVMVYIAVLWTVTDGKKRKLLISCCQQLSGRISGRISGSGPVPSFNYPAPAR